MELLFLLFKLNDFRPLTQIFLPSLLIGRGRSYKKKFLRLHQNSPNKKRTSGQILVFDLLIRILGLQPGISKAHTPHISMNPEFSGTIYWTPKFPFSNFPFSF